MSLSSNKIRTIIPPGILYHKALNFFKPLPGDSPCWGLALGRTAVWAVRRTEQNGVSRIEKRERIPLDVPLFSGAPKPETTEALARALKALGISKKGFYRTVQLALPDPATRFEVFEVEKVPSFGKPLKEFLAWRFQSGQEEQELAFTHQVLGQEEGKNILLSLAMEQRWMEVLKEALALAGLSASFIDAALIYRFNFFHDLFQQRTGGGALVTLEPDYWSLGIWDGAARLRYARAKWWDREIQNPKEIPFQEILLEVERTLRSYVYSAKSRNVSALFLLALPSWKDAFLKAFLSKTEGLCEALDLTELTPGLAADSMELSLSALAAAVKR